MINFKLFSNTKSLSINRQWLQFGIVAVVILASTVLSFWGSQVLFSLLLFIIAGLALVIMLLREPNLGFILVLVGGMFIPFTGPSGLNTATIIIALMLGLWILEMFVIKRNFQFVQSQTMLPIIVFLVVSALSFFIG